MLWFPNVFQEQLGLLDLWLELSAPIRTSCLLIILAGLRSWVALAVASIVDLAVLLLHLHCRSDVSAGRFRCLLLLESEVVAFSRYMIRILLH